MPANTLNGVDDAIRQLATVDLVAGEPLLAQRLVDPNVVPATGARPSIWWTASCCWRCQRKNILSRVGVIKPGDFVDIAATLSFPSDRGIGAAEEDDDEQTTFFLLQNVRSGATDSSANPECGRGRSSRGRRTPGHAAGDGEPQDTLALKYAIDAGGTLDILLRPPGITRALSGRPGGCG